jgi:ubiquinone/menaquinone biosynthesis C-methylase UbiE
MNPALDGQFVKPEIVTTHFHVHEGDIVADFGTGSGFFLRHLAAAAGPSGHVYACEIQKNLVEKIGVMCRQQGLQTVQVLWCDIEEPKGIKLQDDTIDVGILVNTLFILEERVVAVNEIARTLRSGAKLFVIDWSESFGGMGPAPDHVITAADTTALFEGNGFIFEREYPTGPHHYGLAFRKL